MKPNDPNVLLIEVVAKALGPLLTRVVFIGGSTIGLLITDETRPVVRATQDVDLVVELAGKAAYYELSEQLKKQGFSEDPEIICRWRVGGVKVDVMPTDEPILGFSNRWYPRVIGNSKAVTLPSGTSIQSVDGPLLLATKLEAFNGRGNGDYGASHDMEDIINLVDGRSELATEIRECDEELQAYLVSEIDELLGDTNFGPAIRWHLGPTEAEQAREEIIIGRLREIAGV